MSRFRYVSASAFTPTANDIAAAEICTDDVEFTNANKAIGKFAIFYDVKDVPTNTPNRDAVIKWLKKHLDGLAQSAKSIEIYFNADKNNNTAQVLKSDDSKEFCSIWGNGRGNTLPQMSVPAEKVKFGFCVSDGEIVTEMKSNPITGKVGKYVKIYSDISAVL